METIFKQLEVFVVGPVQGLNARGDFQGFFHQVRALTSVRECWVIWMLIGCSRDWLWCWEKARSAEKDALGAATGMAKVANRVSKMGTD